MIPEHAVSAPRCRRDHYAERQRRRNWLLRHAAIAEQQTEVLWWEEKPWSALRAVLLPEREFWDWFNGELGTGEQNKVGAPSSDIRDAVTRLMKKEDTQPAHTVS